jgi:hypothetical protein
MRWHRRIRYAEPDGAIDRPIAIAVPELATEQGRRRASGALERAPNPGGMVGQGAYVDGPRVSLTP